MKVIGIQFKDGGKVYYFAPREEETYEEGMQVVVETSKGAEFAYVAFLPRETAEEEITQPLKPVLRIATDRDREQVRRNAERKPQAMKTAQEKIDKHGLAMKLIDCEFSFEGNKVVFYFAAEGRVDFRELVKDLASTFRMRIELRQVGIRDETRILGGFGPCGRECCCAGALPEFRKVSIKMAKVQGLSLNPGKISGLCGRLMCCLSYENDYYSEVYKKMPKIGAEVMTPEGRGTVVSDNMLKLIVRVKIERDGSLVYKDFPVDDVSVRPKGEGARERAALEEEAETSAEKPARPEKSARSEKPRRSERGERGEGREQREARQPREGRRERPAKEGRAEGQESGAAREERRDDRPPKGEQERSGKNRRNRRRGGKGRGERRGGEPGAPTGGPGQGGDAPAGE